MAAAASVLIANMIGTGVFTALGFQVQTLHTGFALLMLWVVGGLVALCGALVYAELGTAFPESGGEYVYLGRAWHPVLGFLGGWVSMTVGFAAPIALAGIACGRYLSVIVPVPAFAASLAIIALVAAVHLAGLGAARRFQVAVTGTQLMLILLFIGAGLRFQHPIAVPIVPWTDGWRELFSPAFAVSLVYVSYAFTGWNAAGYIAGEVRTPSRTIPRALIGGTLLVTVIYLLLNWTFLRTVPMAALAGTVEVGALSAQAMFGRTGEVVMSAVIATLLVATISAMVLGGSRVTQVVAAGLPRGSWLGRRGPDGVPRRAVGVQLALVIALLVTNSFEQVMLYAGFTLNLMSLLAILGMVRLRWTQPELVRPYRVWGHPVTPALYILLSLWTLGTLVRERPFESFAGLGTVVSGAVVWRLAQRGAAMEA